MKHSIILCHKTIIKIFICSIFLVLSVSAMQHQKDAATYFKKGKALQKKGQNNEAIKMFQKALSLDSKFKPAADSLNELVNKSNFAGRKVKNNVLISKTLPKIKVAISKEFKYVGRFPFSIRDVAGGERFIFVDVDENKKVKRMFIAQFEGFFPHIDNFYRYNFANALTFGKHKFRHNAYAYSNKASQKNNPNGEAALTENFLKERGYILKDIWLMYRYLTVPDKAKKHELILFYLESSDKTEFNVEDYYKDNKETENWKKIYKKIKERSLKSFSVITDTNGMSFIKAATFEMGLDKSKVPELMKKYSVNRAELFLGETPKHKVMLGSYYFDKYEVTNKQFKRFLENNSEWKPENISEEFKNENYLAHWKNGEIPNGEENHPIININWYVSMAYCRSLGKRLPTEAEWEYAARGGLKGKEYPWGNNLDITKANYYLSKFGKTTEVGKYSPNGYGIYDLSGNVWEHLADEWGNYDASNKKNPLAGENIFVGDSYKKVTTRRVTRGGSWGGSPINLRVTYRDSHRPNDPKPFVGFRCAVSAENI